MKPKKKPALQSVKGVSRRGKMDVEEFLVDGGQNAGAVYRMEGDTGPDTTE
jgi:hypothetical protein